MQRRGFALTSQFPLHESAKQPCRWRWTLEASINPPLIQFLLTSGQYGKVMGRLTVYNLVIYCSVFLGLLEETGIGDKTRCGFSSSKTRLSCSWNMQLVALTTTNIRWNESCCFYPLLTWAFGTFCSSNIITSLCYSVNKMYFLTN